MHAECAVVEAAGVGRVSQVRCATPCPAAHTHSHTYSSAAYSAAHFTFPVPVFLSFAVSRSCHSDDLAGEKEPTEGSDAAPPVLAEVRHEKQTCLLSLLHACARVCVYLFIFVSLLCLSLTAMYRLLPPCFVLTPPFVMAALLGVTVAGRVLRSLRDRAHHATCQGACSLHSVRSHIAHVRTNAS